MTMSTEKKYIVLVLALCGACKTTFKFHKAEEVFFTKGKDYNYTLTFTTDSLFTLYEQVIEGHSTCQGRWHYISHDTILLHCNDEPFPAQLQAGYLSVRDIKVVVLNKNQMVFAGVILNRKFKK
jgi:hypothetical protein